MPRKPWRPLLPLCPEPPPLYRALTPSLLLPPDDSGRRYGAAGATGLCWRPSPQLPAHQVMTWPLRVQRSGAELVRYQLRTCRYVLWPESLFVSAPAALYVALTAFACELAREPDPAARQWAPWPPAGAGTARETVAARHKPRVPAAICAQSVLPPHA